MTARLTVLALAVGLLGLGCGAAPAEPTPVTTPPVVEAAPPGIDLAIEVRGRRIDVGATGVLSAEGCDAARFDWERLALIGPEGADIAVAPEVVAVDIRNGERSVGHEVRGPDGTLVASILGPAVMHEATELLRFEPDGTLVDSAPGATPASTSGPVPERYREPVLALVTLVALCWETHPRELVEP